jgi:ABC-type transport system substrate-binding protein
MLGKTAMFTLTILLLASCLPTEISLQDENKGRVTSYRDSKTPSTQAAVHHSGLPIVDEILFKAYIGGSPEEAENIVDGFLAGETDWIEGPARIDLYENVTAAGHKVSSMDPEAEFQFILINCRDYKGWSGEPNFPLKDPDFRVALSYIYGMDQKQADIDSYYGIDWIYAIGNPVPPAQEPWYNESIQMPYTNWTEAWAILQSAGYYINQTEGWLYCNGIRIRDMIVSYAYGPLAYGPVGGFVEAFNDFVVTYLGANGPTMELVLYDIRVFLVDLFVNFEFDFAFLGLAGLGRYVDWLYDLLHSFNVRWWGWNMAGIIDPELDEWLEIIMTSLDVDEIIDAASKVQAKLVYELMPWIPVQSADSFCTTARDERGELMNVISMPNYGPINDWSYMTIHWKGEPNVTWPGGTVTTAIKNEPHTLNPYTDNTPSGWEMLSRTITSLTMLEPVNVKDMPFIATDWEIAHWTSIPELGIENGSMATFYLRQDVTWHDNEPVTAYDCVANMRVIREHKPARYSSTWQYLVYEEAEGPYKFNVYFSQPSVYYANFVARNSLLVPEHIIQLVEEQVDEGILESIFDWSPSNNTYEDLTGQPPPTEYTFLKQLVGCGPFVFDYYNRSQAEGRIERYQDFFVNAPVIGSVVGEWRVNPLTDYTYKSVVQNIAAKEANENGTLTDITVDIKIFEDDILTHEVDGLLLDLWNWTYLGLYTIESVTCGLHDITVEIYSHTDQTLLHSYTHAFTATKREDLTTYTGELLDFTVDMRDVGRAARAFGSRPGHTRWDQACDVNHDFKVDMRDIGNIARKFGWRC